MSVIILRNQRRAWRGSVEQTGLYLGGQKIWTKPASGPSPTAVPDAMGITYWTIDPASAFQDAAGTIPITHGSPIARVNSRGVPGRDMIHANAATRPTAQLVGGRWRMVFNGVDQQFFTETNIGLLDMSRNASDLMLAVMWQRVQTVNTFDLLTFSTGNNASNSRLSQRWGNSAPQTQSRRLDNDANALVTGATFDPYAAPFFHATTRRYQDQTGSIRINGAINALQTGMNLPGNTEDTRSLRFGFSGLATRLGHPVWGWVANAGGLTDQQHTELSTWFLANAGTNLPAPA